MIVKRAWEEKRLIFYQMNGDYGRLYCMYVVRVHVAMMVLSKGVHGQHCRCQDDMVASKIDRVQVLDNAFVGSMGRGKI